MLAPSDMTSRAASRFGLLSLLIAWPTLVAVGIWLFYDAVNLALANGFPPGSLIFLVLLVVWSIRGRWESRTLSEWMWTIVPLFVWVFLYGRVQRAVQELAVGQSPLAMRTYVVDSFIFLSFVFLWIIGFPDDEVFAFDTRRSRLLWRGVLTVVGSVVAIVQVRYTMLPALESGLSSSQLLHAFQLRLVFAVCVLYFLLLGRTFLPATIRDLPAALRRSK